MNCDAAARTYLQACCAQELYALPARLVPAGVAGGLSSSQGATPRTVARRSILDKETFHLQRSMAET